jgi:hypothetical protein
MARWKAHSLHPLCSTVPSSAPCIGILRKRSSLKNRRARKSLQLGGKNNIHTLGSRADETLWKVRNGTAIGSGSGGRLWKARHGALPVTRGPGALRRRRDERDRGT